MKTLEWNEMEAVLGGERNLRYASTHDGGGGGGWEDCDFFFDGLGGAALVIGAASWYTGAGAGLALGLSAVAYGGSFLC